VWGELEVGNSMVIYEVISLGVASGSEEVNLNV
jgi:hypothetical protein